MQILQQTFSLRAVIGPAAFDQSDRTGKSPPVSVQDLVTQSVYLHRGPWWFARLDAFLRGGMSRGCEGVAVKRWKLVAAVLLGLNAGPGLAQTTSGQFSVHALGVKVGDLAIAGSVGSEQYTISAQFVTSGLAAAVAGVRFVMKSSGTTDGTKFSPRAYSEDMDTGKRESRVALRWSSGVASASGSQVGDRGPYTVTRAQQRGAVDPLTAIYMVVRDQPTDAICNMRQRIYDGERLTEIVLTNRSERSGKILCSGVFRRVAGYSPEDLRERGQFGLKVTYEPAGDVVRATRVQADTIYGKARLQRR